MTKRCLKCGVEKSLDDFSKQKLGKFGRRSRCRECISAEHAIYRAKNQARIKAYNSGYRAANREDIRTKGRAYWAKYVKAHPRDPSLPWPRWQKDPDAIRAQKRAWREANADKVRQQRRESQARNRATALARVERWRKENPEKHRAQRLKRRSQKVNAPGASYTTEKLIRARVDLYGGRCYYCDKEGADSIDHRIPLSRGGSHWPANLVPCCRRCNSSKNVKTELEFLAA